MNKNRKSRRLCVAVGGLCSFGLLSGAIASPPSVKSSLSTFDSARSISAAGRSFAYQQHTTTLLDLRPPVESTRATIRSGAAALPSTPFPSAIHHLDLGKADLGTDDRIQLPAMDTGEEHFRMTSQAETLANRVHREGLPVARLWESKSALLSIGLNQKGKPGMWLTQKTR
jgi:hypothetical protein